MQRRLEAAPSLSLEAGGTQLNYAILAGQTESYTAMDLEDLVSNAVHQAVIRAGSGSGAATKVSLFVTMVGRCQCADYSFVFFPFLFFFLFACMSSR